jgi:hypothetical protein
MKKEYSVGKICAYFSPRFSDSLPDVSAGFQRALVAESVMIRTRITTNNRSEIVAAFDTPCATPHSNTTVTVASLQAVSSVN